MRTLTQIYKEETYYIVSKCFNDISWSCWGYNKKGKTRHMDTDYYKQAYHRRSKVDKKLNIYYKTKMHIKYKYIIKWGRLYAFENKKVSAL